jgi:hypothetical protein
MNSSSFVQTNKRSFILLIVAVFLAKLLLAGYFAHLGNCRNPELSLGYLAKVSGDTFSYLDPMDNYLTEGEYYFWNGARKVFAGRMPYYGLPYFFFRLFFDKSVSADLLALLQIFLDALATVYFARLCRDVLESRAAFWIGLALYFCSFNYFLSATYISTESLSLSLTVLFLYKFHRYWTGGDKRQALVASVFLSLAILLKPYLLPLILLFFLTYLYKEKFAARRELREVVAFIAVMMIPLGAMLFPWFLRNTITLQQLVITQESTTAGYNYTPADFAFRRFATGWGGDDTFWDAKSPSCHFKLNPPVECDFRFPSYSLTSRYTLEDIERVRQDYLLLQKNYSPELDEKVVAGFDRLTDAYKDERPLMYYVGSGFLRMKTIMWHTNNNNLPIHASSPCYGAYQLGFKIVQFIIYALSLTLGLAGLIWLLWQRKVSLIFAFLPIYLLLFFCFYIRLAEARYFTQAYPVVLLGLASAAVLIYSWIKNRFLRRKDSKLL